MKKHFMEKLIALFALCPFIASAMGISSKAAEITPLPNEAGFVYACDGAKIEYAVYNNSAEETLLLLSPNNGDMHYFDDNILTCMVQHYKVITVSMRGMGNSERGFNRLTFELMSDDVKSLLDLLKIDKTNIFGFSDGGNLGLLFTLREPQRVSKLAIMGANLNPLGTKAYFQVGVIIKFIFYSVLATITNDKAFNIKRDTASLMVNQPNMTFSDLSKIKIPVLNIYGQYDLIRRTHSKLITSSISDCRELIVTGGGHSNCFEQTDNLLNPTLVDFFN